MSSKNSIGDYENAAWGMQLKYDGHRRITRVQNGEVDAWSRLLNPAQWPDHIVHLLRLLPNGVYDAEAYIPGGQATDVKRLDRSEDMFCAIFDVLELDNFSCCNCTYGYRNDTLRNMVEAATVSAYGQLPSAVNLFPVHVPVLYPVLADTLDNFWSNGHEGVVIKRMTSVYEPGRRSPNWVKMKRSCTCDVTVTGFGPGKLGDHSIIHCIDDAGQIVDVKTRNDMWRAVFKENWALFIGGRLRIRYETRATEGGYRHPGAIIFHVNSLPTLPGTFDKQMVGL